MFLLPFTLFSPSPESDRWTLPHRMVIIFRIFCVARGVSLTIGPLIKGAQIENISLKPGTKKDNVLIIDLMPMSWQRLYPEMPKLSLANKQPLWILKNLKITCQSSLLPFQQSQFPDETETCCSPLTFSQVKQVISYPKLSNTNFDVFKR